MVVLVGGALGAQGVGAAVAADEVPGAAFPGAAAGEAANGLPTYRCSQLWNAALGVVVDTTVEGNVVVDAEADWGCAMHEVTVTGDVTVPVGGRLTGAPLTVGGDLRVAGHADVSGYREDSAVDGDVLLEGRADVSLDLGARAVGGDVLLDGGVGSVFWIRAASVGGGVTGRVGSATLHGVAVAGAYDVAVEGTTRLRGGTSVAGPVTVRGGRLLVHDVTVGRDLTVDGAGDVLVCRADVADDLLVTRLTDYARIGVERDLPCATRVGGSLVLVDVPHSVDLGDVDVARHLVCSGVSGPRGVTRTPALRVGGGEYGSCR
ncbi:hypothetical protein Q760_10150 [Cellulomonas cellasea DSM 20118]|uniref:Uncharacterized protein n=1 Tax=Cellulomonas cellasea DSM 20118 TaxID=1408250 RepID=A0A0A0BAH4_9CELL|nr:hypothetical protein Q760_10150 [Cellulomonas cellasea DSM 20118]